MKCLKSLWDKDKFEVTLRVGLMCFCGFSLSIASIPRVVPPELALMPGLLSAILSTCLPSLMLTLTLIPVAIVAVLGVCAGGTMLLAAGSVSNGCFVGVFTANVLLLTTLYFGKFYSMTSSLATVFMSVQAMVALAFLPVVKEYGLQVVSLMWTEKGTENKLAIFRNLLIVVCWTFACLTVGIIVPPWRTSRQLISRGLLPVIFKQVNGVLSGDNVDMAALAKSKTTLNGGNVVMSTILEPRLHHFFVDLVTPLKQIAIATDDLILRALLVLKWKEGLTEPPNELETIVLQDTTTLLEECGEALALNDRKHYDTLRDFVDDKVFNRMLKVGSTANVAESENPEHSNANYIYQQALRVRKPTLAYLRAFNHGVVTMTSKQKTLSLLKSGIMYFALMLLPTSRLLTAPALLFQPKKWNFRAIMWSLELAAGFVALICMSVYWDAYADFRIAPKDTYVGPVYGGWQLLGYAFAWMPTYEGTFAKGKQRILGTCFGGFFAWLGIIVCSWSYDNNAPVNPYGLIAWLTIFTMINTYFWTLSPGAAAHSGMDKDHGYGGMYFSLTQSLIAIEVFQGAGDKNGMTLNRVIATSTGVAFAIVISFLPPTVSGRDPKHTRAYLDALNDAFTLLLRTFVDEAESSKFSDDSFKKSLLSTAESKRAFALYVLNDADRLQVLPIFRVNEELRSLLDRMGITEASIEHLCDGLADVITKECNVNEARTSIQAFVEDVLDAGNAVLDGPTVGIATEDFTVGWAYEIARHLEQHRQALDKLEA